MLNQSEANLAKDEAALGQAEANLVRDKAQQKYAQSQAERYGRLLQAGIVSKDQSEQMGSNADALAAAVNADEAAIRSARAAVVATKATLDNSRVQLEYTTIRSAINGRTGNIMIKQGNIVAANTVDLTTINQVEPIYVTFSVPEAQLPAIKRYMSEGQLQVIATPQADTAVQERGVLTFVDNTVDTTTGMIKLKGTFANKDHRLWPGVFARVTLRLTTQPNMLVVPNQAVQTGQEGAFVFVVKPDRTVESRPVVTGSRIDQEIVISSGLRPGETVVTEGQLRLGPGSGCSLAKAAACPAKSAADGAALNISATFIRRPIATSLLMLAIALFGVIAYHALAGKRPAERRLPHSRRLRQPARRQPRHHGLRRGYSHGAAVYRHRRTRFDDRRTPSGSTSASHCNSI